ncbi:MAG: hypothetical protein LM577_06700 [Thermoproteaceae archaeon]|nr:hypothetical protein [Thermoproteaceae archaeon]
MTWLSDVLRATEIIRRGGFKVITHGGIAHADDTIAAALLYRHGAIAVYRLNSLEEVLRVDGEAILADIGDAFRDALPERYVVLDHHGVSDPSEEPSSVVQVALAVGARVTPLVSTLVHFVDLFDRYGPRAKRWSGPYGSSLNIGVARYFSDSTPHGAAGDVKFLELVANAVYSKLDVDLPAFREAFALVEKLPLAGLAESFPRTFTVLRLMLSAARDAISASTSREALETGFGVDFGCYAVLAVPELEPYALRGLERHFAEARRAAEAASAGRYALVRGNGITAITIDDYIAPGPLWNALQDLGVISAEPVFVVVRDKRNPGAYALWRPDRFADVIDFRKLQGSEVLYKHPSGFFAVMRAESAEAAARAALSRLTQA